MVDNEYYWRDFVKEVQIQLNSLIKQLHLAYERRNDCIYNIKDNLAKYQEAGVDVSVVFDIDNRSKIYFNKKQDALLGTKLSAVRILIPCSNNFFFKSFVAPQSTTLHTSPGIVFL